MKFLTVVGARPQFIKASPVTKILRESGHQEILVHTGQHYDYNMSDIFFDELGIPQPDFNLNIGSGSHAYQTAQMLVKLETLIDEHQPDWVVVYGDTNSTLAGAIASVKLHISLAHIEAGLRSFNRKMPEEHNRVLTDHCADALFCPTQTAVELLAKEGITKNVFLVGDTMYDAVLQSLTLANQRSSILEKLCIEPQDYFLITIHRPYNTDVPENMEAIFTALAELDETIVFPVHPRTRTKLPNIRVDNLHLIEPLGYLDMLVLEQNARMILTDSGGIQKEAYFLKTPCLTLRPETEWVETLDDNWNVIVGADTVRILDAVRSTAPVSAPLPVFGDGHAAEKIVRQLEQLLEVNS